MTGQPAPGFSRLRVADIVLDDLLVPGHSTVGAAPRLRAVPRRRTRRIHLRAIQRQLHSAPSPRADTLIDVDFDESASVRGGNDVIGLRHELVVVALEHLARAKSDGRWFVRVRTFDEPSVYDMSVAPLDRRGLRGAQEILLRESAGGSSVLHPSLRRAEEEAAIFAGARLQIVLSDFELYDADPTSALQAMIDSSATQVLGISLRNDPPPLLLTSRVRTARVLSTDSAADLANHVIDAAHACVVTEGRNT